MSIETNKTNRNISLTGVLRRARQAWFRHPKLAVLAVIFLFVQQSFQTFFAYSLKLIVDNVMDGSNQPSMSMILLSLIIAFIIMATASFLGENINAQANVLIINDIRRQLYIQLQRLSASFYSTTKMGDILARFSSDMKALEAGYTQAYLNTILTGLGLMLNIPLLFYLEWRLALMTVILVPSLQLFTRRLLGQSMEAGVEQREAEANVINAVQETVRAQQIIKTFVLEPTMTQRFDKKLNELGKTTIKARLATSMISRSSSLGVLMVQLIVMLTGASLAFKGEVSIGSFVSFIAILNTVMKDVYEFSKKVVPVLVEASTGIGRIEELLDAPLGVQDTPNALTLPQIEHGIHFEDVTFSYTGEQMNLKQVNLHIPAGHSAVFVGSSGSGKSTILSLIMRFYDPQQGRVLFDHNDIHHVKQTSLRSQMSAVFQENYLFNASIAENIRLGNPDATDEQVENAARLAEIHDMIINLPDGYQTSVGEAGGRLSGGQRQRIAIARAILPNPRILILDEATSALDPATETAINATLEKIGKGRTVISITHRLNSAKNADQIYVMQYGSLVEQGTHKQLLTYKGVYYNHWQKQHGFEISEDGRLASIDSKRLNSIALFANLSPDILEQISHQFQSENYPAEQTVISQGEFGDKFYIIVRGQVSVSARDKDGKVHILESLEDGDHFGEMALLTNHPRTATIETLIPCLFLTISREKLLELMEKHPEIRGVLQARMETSVRNLLVLG